MARDVQSDAATEHAHLQGLIVGISDTLAERKADCTEVHRLLKRLFDVMIEHFRHEESGGLFQQVIEVAPRLKPRADILCQQHSVMTNQLEEMLHFAEQGELSTASWQSIAVEFDTFANIFRMHESAEHALLFDAFVR